MLRVGVNARKTWPAERSRRSGRLAEVGRSGTGGPCFRCEIGLDVHRRYWLLARGVFLNSGPKLKSAPNFL